MPARSVAPSIRRLRTAAEFERLLRQRPCVISAHFAVHHLGAERDTRIGGFRSTVVPDLSTEPCAELAPFVDDLREERSIAGLELGVVVPKRHARRAVTRSLIKRELRAAWQRGAPALAPGAWLVRLRAAFDVAAFASAASTALRRAVRFEVEQVMERCVATSAASSAA